MASVISNASPLVYLAEADRLNIIYSLFEEILLPEAVYEEVVWQAAKRCNISLWEMIQEAKQRHIHASYDMQELEKDLAALYE
jgi:predicted nucleic acid-binding protein